MQESFEMEAAAERSDVLRLVPAPAEDIHQVLGSALPWSQQILGLLASGQATRQGIDPLGIGPAGQAGLIANSLPEPESVLLVAQRSERLSGLLDLVPELWPSASLGHRMWTVRHLVLGPSAPEDLPVRLLERGCDLIDGQVDFLAAYPNASDAGSIQGLKRAGFRVMGGEIVGFIRDLDVRFPRLSSMSFGPLTPAHMAAAFALAPACSRCMPHALDPGFDPDRLTDMTRGRMTCCDGQMCGTTAAWNRHGKLLGVLGYSLDTRLEAFLNRKLAHLDYAGVTPGCRGEGISTLLLQHTLAYLGQQGVEAVCARTVMHGTGPTREMAALRKLGFTIAATNLIMHRWTRPLSSV